MAKLTKIEKAQMTEFLGSILMGLGSVMLFVVWLDHTGEKIVDWQTSLTGMGGFIGLIVVHLLSAKHQRQRDEDIRRTEAKAIATALRVEIKYLSMFAKRHVTEIREKFPDIETEPASLNEAGKIGATTPQAVVFEAFADRLNFLTPTAIDNIVVIHMLLGVYNKAVQSGSIHDFAVSSLEGVVQGTERALTQLDKIIDA